jgi:prepilin-type N-terminal cleavage/methylation domain-containing protein
LEGIEAIVQDLDWETAMPYRRRGAGFTLIELLIGIAIIGILAAIAIPNILSSQRRSRYASAASDAKTAVTQALIYGTDKGAYPTTLEALRTAGYGSVPDDDPWRIPFVLAPAMASGARPTTADDIYVYSKGPNATAAYVPGLSATGTSGAVGYSSIYGAFTGE